MDEEAGKQENPLVKAAKEYMEEHYAEAIFLADVAEKLGTRLLLSGTELSGKLRDRL